FRRAEVAVFIAVVAFLFFPPLAPAQEHFDLKHGQWVKRQTYPPNTAQGQLQAISQKLEQNQAETAQTLAQAWLKEYPSGTLRAQALLLLGDAKVAQKHYYDALFAYERLIRGYPASKAFDTALDREY